jgi:hypothetical protein
VERPFFYFTFIRILENTMFATFKTAARLAGTSLAGVAFASVVTLPAMAEKTAHQCTPAAKAALSAAAKTPATTATPTAVTTANGMIAVRDAETGELRAPTAEEAAALQSSAAKRDGTTGLLATPQPKVHTSGARGTRLTDEFATFSVAVKRADGSVEVEHVEGKSNADATVKAAKVAPAPAQLPTK